jgi:hypothetical protein
VSLTDQNQRRRFALVIAGLPQVYYSGSSTGLSSVSAIGSTLAGVARTFSESIISVSDYGAELEPIGGVASYQAITISLAVDRRGGASEPGTVFSRLGPRATGASHAFLLEPISHTDTTPITVDTDRDLSAVYSAGDLCHIDAETFRVSGTTGGASPTITLDQRGVGETPIQDHQLGLAGSNKPELTDQVVYWRGRRASIWVSSGRSDGSWGDWVELMRGFLDNTPEVDDGVAITLQVVPLTAMVDEGLTGGVSRQTTLLHGYHDFEEGVGDTFEWACGIGWGAFNPQDMPNIVGEGAATWSSHAANNIVDTGGHDHPTIFDITLQTADGQPYTEHPRIGSIFLRYRNADGTSSTITLRVDAYHYHGADLEGYELDQNVHTYNFGPFQHGYLTPVLELHRYTIPSGVRLWPAEFIAGYNAASPADQTGLAGGFLKWAIRETEGLLYWDLTPHIDAPLRAAVYTYSSWAAWLGDELPKYYGANGPQLPLAPVQQMVLPIDPATSGAETYPRIWPDDRSLNEATLYPREWRQQELSRQSYRFRDYALGWWQPSERILLISEQIAGIPSAAGAQTFFVSIRSYDRRRDEEITQYVRATHQTAVTYDGATVGYRLHLSRRQRTRMVPVVDWASRGTESRAIVSSSVRFEDASPGEVLLTLLESGGGGGINGTYDTTGVGLNISSTFIDEDSFLSLGSGTRISNMTFSLAGDDVEIRDIFESVLRSIGAAMVLRRTSTAGARLKLTLVPVGMEVATRVSQTVSAGDWLADPPPSWGVFEASVNQLQVAYDYDEDEAEFRGEVTINNERAINAYSQERLSLDLSLYGATAEELAQNTADIYSALRPVFTRIFRIGSDPVRLWRGTVGFHLGHLLEVGAYVQVSSPELRGYGDSYGVNAGVGMVRSVRQSLTGEGVEVEVLHYAFGSAGWNVAAELKTITNATTIEVENFTYGRGQSPTGVTRYDVEFFSVGDVIDYIPPGDEDSATTLTIASISGNEITFSAAHGIASAVGHIEPTTYDSAPASHQARAYLADAAGTLGTAANDGQEYL